MIRVCPKRDTKCPHGEDCPYTIDKYTCKPEPDWNQKKTSTEIGLEAIGAVVVKLAEINRLIAEGTVDELTDAIKEAVDMIYNGTLASYVNELEQRVETHREVPLEFLAAIDAEFMILNGCFPPDGTLPSQKRLYNICSAVRDLTGLDYAGRKHYAYQWHLMKHKREQSKET